MKESSKAYSINFISYLDIYFLKLRRKKEKTKEREDKRK
jgi:hypothetical protein